MTDSIFQPDVFIAGGGPAGLVTAIASRRKGLRVTVADRGQPEIDKACGEGLMPDALAALESIGVTLPSAKGHTFRGIRFSGHGSQAEALFPEGVGLGIRRTALHGILAQHAEAAGVNLLWNAPVTLGGDQSVQVLGRSVQARFLVGADGENSTFRRWAGLDALSSDGRRFGFRQHFRLTPWTDFVEVHWADGCQVYVTPVAADQVCVASLARDPAFRLERALKMFPEVAARLDGAEPVGVERGAVSASRHLRRVATRNCALVGDASGSVDAVTGEGLCLAFRQAVALASALETGDLKHYQAAAERIRRGPALMSDLLLLLDRRNGLRRRVLSSFTARPRIFSRMLAMHTGAPSPLFVASTLMSLGWGLLVS